MENENELKLNYLILQCNVYNLAYGTHYQFFDQNSIKNIEKKIPVLLKLLEGEKLTKEEFYSRDIFELLPDNAESIL